MITLWNKYIGKWFSFELTYLTYNLLNKVIAKRICCISIMVWPKPRISLQKTLYNTCNAIWNENNSSLHTYQTSQKSLGILGFLRGLSSRDSKISRNTGILRIPRTVYNNSIASHSLRLFFKSLEILEPLELASLLDKYVLLWEICPLLLIQPGKATYLWEGAQK